MSYRKSARKVEDPADAADIAEMTAAARKRTRRVALGVSAALLMLVTGVLVIGATWKKPKRLHCHKITITQVYDNRPSQPNGQERTIETCEWK